MAHKYYLRKEAARTLGTSAKVLKDLEAQGLVTPDRDPKRRIRYTQETIDQARPHVAALGAVTGPVQVPAQVSAPVTTPVSVQPVAQVAQPAPAAPPREAPEDDVNWEAFIEICRHALVLLRKESGNWRTSVDRFLTDFSDPSLDAVPRYWGMTEEIEQMCRDNSIDPSLLWQTILEQLRKKYWTPEALARLAARDPDFAAARGYAPPASPAPALPSHRPAPAPRYPQVGAGYGGLPTSPSAPLPTRGPGYPSSMGYSPYSAPVPPVSPEVQKLREEADRLKAERDIRNLRRAMEEEEAREEQRRFEDERRREDARAQALREQEEAEAQRQYLGILFQAAQNRAMEDEQEERQRQAAQAELERNLQTQIEAMAQRAWQMMSALPRTIPADQVQALAQQVGDMIRSSPTEATLIQVQDLVSRTAAPYERAEESQLLADRIFNTVLAAVPEHLGNDARLTVSEAMRGYLQGREIDDANFTTVVSEVRQVVEGALAPFEERHEAAETAAMQQEVARQRAVEEEVEARRLSQEREYAVKSAIRSARNRGRDLISSLTKEDGSAFGMLETRQLLDRADEMARAEVDQLVPNTDVEDVRGLAGEYYRTSLNQLLGVEESQ